MKGLDTNVLVRYLTQDDPIQSPLAARALDRDGSVFIISPIVLCELVWVLESAYGYDRQTIATVMESILRTAQFEILDKDIVWKALEDYRLKKGDFSDYYLGYQYLRDGADTTLTFDKALADSHCFEIIGKRS